MDSPPLLASSFADVAVNRQNVSTTLVLDGHTFRDIMQGASDAPCREGTQLHRDENQRTQF